LKLEKWHLSLTLICLLFGVLFTSNLKTQLQVFNPMAARNKTLVTVIKTQEEKNKELEAEIARIRETIEKYTSPGSIQAELEPIQKDLEKLKILAGLTEVHGPGVVITLDDQEKARTARDPEYYLIHYSSILYIINDLRAAGAEAITVNNDRVVSTTDIRCAGNIILVNTHRLAPPYEIKAIGNPDLLEEIVRTGEYTSLEFSKFPVSIVKRDNIVIPPYKGSYTFNYAAPPKEGEK